MQNISPHLQNIKSNIFQMKEEQLIVFKYVIKVSMCLYLADTIRNIN